MFLQSETFVRTLERVYLANADWLCGRDDTLRTDFILLEKKIDQKLLSRRRHKRSLRISEVLCFTCVLVFNKPISLEETA